jgi:putative transposase
MGGMVYHVLNRGNNRETIFHKPADYDAFVQLLIEGKRHADIDLFSFSLMPNHWHAALRPHSDADLSKYLSWITNTHVKRYQAHYRERCGHLYQGRYKSFPVEEDHHFLILCRYVEANPFRAKLVADAREWRWSSACRNPSWDYSKLLHEWPVDRPSNWSRLLNMPMDEQQESLVRTSIARNRPLGTDQWIDRICKRCGLILSSGKPGRPPGKKSGAV